MRQVRKVSLQDRDDFFFIFMKIDAAEYEGLWFHQYVSFDFSSW